MGKIWELTFNIRILYVEAYNTLLKINEWKVKSLRSSLAFWHLFEVSGRLRISAKHRGIQENKLRRGPDLETSMFFLHFSCQWFLMVVCVYIYIYLDYGDRIPKKGE